VSSCSPKYSVEVDSLAQDPCSVADEVDVPYLRAETLDATPPKAYALAISLEAGICHIARLRTF